MAIEFQEVLNTGVVLAGVALLGEEQQRDKFADAVQSETHWELIVQEPQPGIGGPTNVGETGVALHLLKDRIRLISTSSRASIDRQYPLLDDLVRLAEVAGHAIDHTSFEGQTLIAIGFNIQLIYRPSEETPSERYIADRLFSHRCFANEEWALVGGGGKLSFEGQGARWNFTVEPRANDSSSRRIFLSLNMHRDTQQIPNREEILSSLQEVWNRSRDFAVQLDTSV